MSDHPLPRGRLTRRQILQAGAAAGIAGLFGGPLGALPAFAQPTLPDEDGYDLWLRYRRVGDTGLLASYRRQFTTVAVQGQGDVVESAAGELVRGLTGLLGRDVPRASSVRRHGTVVLGLSGSSEVVTEFFDADELQRLGPEGYAIKVVRPSGILLTAIASVGPAGLLYGAFHLLRLLQRQRDVEAVDVSESPATPIRMLDHWDNLDRSVERGYAGRSIFAWDDLPEVVQRYTDYARTLASIGINQTCVNNVNASAEFLSTDRLSGLAALADVLRPWGIALYVSANYASPMVLTEGDDDPITVADPLDARVQGWWRDKINEIYQLIPDFGGFLVKANSEGQPGPLDYGRTHAEGANMLADRLADHDGVLIWRSFVHEGFSDWAEYQHRIFSPLDGDFVDNAVVQTKNGPIDFQVREPVNPLFGAMPHTNQLIELQITQEYTGHSTHLCYLVPEWSEVLAFNTYTDGDGPTVADIVTGAAYDQSNVGMAGVANIGDDRDWTGYQLGQANLHGFGRLAWQPSLTPKEIVTEWVEMTYGCDTGLVDTLVSIMLGSWTTYEDYSSPLGMGYLTFPTGAHFDPDPRSTLNQSHYTTEEGTGFDRTVATGTGYTGLYADHWADIYESLDDCPDELLLFMHWVPYTHRLQSGKTVIQHIYDSHFDGFTAVEEMRDSWSGLQRLVDAERHADVSATFDQHLIAARDWRDTMVAFFFSSALILDDKRSWLQAELPGGALLLGGWPNLIDARITNASAEEASVSTAIELPDAEWQGGTAEAVIASKDTATVHVPVTPPLIADQVTLDLSMGSDLTTLGSKDHLFVVSPAAERCHLALDAGTGSSPLVSGYQRLTPNTAWDDERGFGWVAGGTKPQERDRGDQWDALRRDFCGNYPAATLRIRVPAGDQRVWVLTGDGGPDAYPMTITIDDAVVAEADMLLGGTFTWIDFAVDGGADGRVVDLVLDSLPDRMWHLGALVIMDPASTMPEVVVSGVHADPVWVGPGPHDVSVSIVNTVADRDLSVTISVAASEGWEAEPTQQSIPAGSQVTVPVSVTTSGAPQLSSLEVTVSADAEISEGPWQVDVCAVPSGDDVALAVDAGSPGSPVLDTYGRLSPDDVWDAAGGYGWIGTVPDHRDRARMDVLRRDLVLGRDVDHVLRVAVPAGDHRMWIMTGDAYSPSGTTTVLEDGVELANSGPDLIAQGSFLWFSFELSGGENGRTADLTLVGSQRDGYWRVVAAVLI